MPAPENMDQKPFGHRELVPPTPDRAKPLLDHRSPSGFVAVQNLLNLRQRHADALAGPQNPHPLKMFLAVITVSRRGPVGNDDTDVLPMPEDMCGHPQTSRGFSDLHFSIVTLDFRST